MPGKRGALADRFWAKVKKTESCWLWEGATRYGYSHFGLAAGRSVPGHRFAYEALVGPIPEGLVIDHLCRVRACVNPAHLEAVTHRVNILRGVAPNSLTAAQGVCRAGHSMTDALVGRRADGSSYNRCRPCLNAWQRARRNRQSA